VKFNELKPTPTKAALALISWGAGQNIATPNHTNLGMWTRIFDVEGSFTLQQNLSRFYSLI
jgi:hypothetical protein